MPPVWVRWYGGAAALLEFLTAAARAVIIAADLRWQARFGFLLRVRSHERVEIREIFDLIGFHTHNHFPAEFLSKADDLLGLLSRSHANHSRPLMVPNFATSDLPGFQSAATPLSLPSRQKASLKHRALALGFPI
jgi:hypothetical protein